MTRTLLKLTLVLTFVVLGVATSAGAQTLESARAVIPFEFVIEGKKFPAGNYTIRPFDTDHRLVFLEHSEVKDSRAVLFISPDESGDATQIIFDVSGKNRILRAIRKRGQ